LFILFFSFFLFHCVFNSIIKSTICLYTKSKQTIYFLTGAGVVVAVFAAAWAFNDFLDVCVRFARFFASFCAVSPVKYEVTFFNSDESDHEDFFGST
jgi:hypothetical protein